MNNQADLLAAERARALSMILLTSREDLRIIEPKSDNAVIHFLVEIDKPARPALRTFGVVWEAQIAPATDVQANQALKPRLQELAGAIEFTFPVCLFFFTMQDDKARYTWIAEPVVGADGRPDLLIRLDAHCSPLDREAINTVVDRVEAWYDARSLNGVSANTSRTENCAHADICQYIPNKAISPGSHDWAVDSPLQGSAADWSVPFVAA